MFLRNRKAIPALRLLSLLLVGFQVLAAGRALVPNLCLTQRDAARAAAASAGTSCCTAPMHSCCAQPARQGSGNAPAAPAGGENPRCPFCFLAKAYTEPPLVFLHPFWQELADAPYDRGPGACHSRPADDHTQGRAPPAINA